MDYNHPGISEAFGGSIAEENEYLKKLTKLRAKITKVKMLQAFIQQNPSKTFLTANEVYEEVIPESPKAIENEEEKEERNFSDMLADLENLKNSMSQIDELEDLRRRIARTRKGINQYSSQLTNLKENISSVYERDKTFAKNQGIKRTKPQKDLVQRTQSLAKFGFKENHSQYISNGKKSEVLKNAVSSKLL